MIFVVCRGTLIFMKGGRNDLKVSYYLKRIINDKIKLGFIFLLFLLPIMDLISTLVSIHHGATSMAPWSSTFLSLTSTSFIFHSLFFNFLPLYLLIISCDDCFEDCTTKYRNILISKWGKKDYVITNITKSFCISFFLILFTLLLNMLMSEIIFNTATYSIFSENLVDEDKTSLFYIEATHPTVTNIIYIFITSLLSGAIGAAGSALAMAIKIRKIVYPLLFLLWFLPAHTDKSIMLALQPFCEYGLDTKIPVFVITLGIFVVLTIGAAIKEVHYAKI